MWKSLFWEHFNRLKQFLVALHDTYESTGVESTAVSAKAKTKVQITLSAHSPGFSQCKVICQIPQILLTGVQFHIFLFFSLFSSFLVKFACCFFQFSSQFLLEMIMKFRRPIQCWMVCFLVLLQHVRSCCV